MSRDRLSRRAILGGAMATGTGLILTGSGAQGQTPAPAQSAKKAPEKKPPLKAELVKEFVIAGHGKFDRVKELLAEQPKLLNACHDWGGGDWESALGGAAHTGSREIAEYLVSHGARLDLFAATMLGHLDLVRAALTAMPGLLSVPGPHGISLIDHAKMGKEPAAAVLAYLQGLADAAAK